MDYRLPPSVKVFFPDAQPIFPKAWSASRKPLVVDQIAIVVHDIEASIEKFGAAFNWGPFFIGYGEDTIPYRGELTSYRVKLAFVQVGDMEVELLQPLRGKTPHHEVLAERGEGLLHLRLVTDSVEESLAHLAALGIEPIFGYKAHGKWVNVYVDSHEFCGVRTELFPGSSTISQVMQSLSYDWLSNQKD